MKIDNLIKEVDYLKEYKINKEKEITKLKIDNVRIVMQIETINKTIFEQGKASKEIMKETKAQKEEIEDLIVKVKSLKDLNPKLWECKIGINIDI